MTPPAWRPYSRRAAWIRRLLPRVDLTVPLPGGLALTANLRTHLGLFRPSTRAREIRAASAIAALAPPDAVIYDVGANIGLYTLVFAADRRRPVVSFEPSPLALPYLHRNVAANGLTNVRVEAVALSDRAGRVTFALDPVTTCTSHVAAPGEPGIAVDALDLDTCIAARGLPAPGLIKLDVEGHDEAILRGMAGVLRAHRPLVCLEGGLRGDDGQIAAVRLLEASGYTVWDLGRRRRLTAATEEYVVVGVPRHPPAG